MNKFLKDLQDKSTKLVEVAGSENALEEGKKLLKGLKRKALLKSVKGELSGFYSNANYLAVKNMIQEDTKALTVLPVAQPSKKDAVTSLKEKYGKVQNTPASMVMPDLRFFDLYLEIKTQEILYQKYPNDVLKDPVQLERYNELVSEINALSALVIAYAKKNNQLPVYNSKLAEKNKALKDYNDIISLIK